VRRGAIVKVIFIALLVAAATTAIAIFIPWLPEQSSEEGERIDFVFWFVTAICIGVFALVAGISVYAGLKFRVRPDDDTDGPPVHGHTGLEIAWTAVPFVLVTAIGIISAIVLAQNDRKDDDRLRVNVLAQQFTWSFTYPEDGNIASTILRLPVDRQVELFMNSNDVIHSFFVPEFRQKMDVLPGEETTLLITPTKTGEYTIQCAELCGLGHAAMLQRVEVMPAAAFEQWTREMQEGMSGEPDEVARTVFDEQGCAGCHAFEPAGSSGETGPDLDNLASSAEEAGRPLEDYVRESIVNPGAYLHPGYPNVMPPFDQLPDEQLDALVQFLVGGQEAGS
jgi:cytochrome c oxidase subunit 2